MVPQNCEDRFPFICYKDNLILIKENKTWEEALEYCMIIGYKLVSVQPGADHANMMSMIEYEGGTEKVGSYSCKKCWREICCYVLKWDMRNNREAMYTNYCSVETKNIEFDLQQVALVIVTHNITVLTIRADFMFFKAPFGSCSTLKLQI